MSAPGLLLLERFEGKVTRPDVSQHEGVVHVAYADPAHGWKVPTICSGHTKGVKRGDVATEAQCREYLIEDTDEALWSLLQVAKVPLTQGELDAYVDFIFNIGETKFRKSTLLRHLNAGKHRAACDELLKWVNANGKPLKGLVKRRAAFHQLCIKDLP
jgi:lysozyme